MTKKSKTKYYIILAIVTVVFWLINLTPINPRDRGFFIKLIILSILIILPQVINISINKERKSANPIENIRISFSSLRNLFKKGSDKGLVWIPILLIIIYFILTLTSAEIFRSRDYSKLLTVEETKFPGNIAEVNFTDIPTVDRGTAQHLGSKKMGEIADLVSQFEVSPDYTQINYQGRPVRVTPLRYGDFFKWLINRSEGLPRIIRVDMIDSSVTLQSLESGMKYSESEPLFRNIKRHLRLRYPFAIMDNPIMEVDEEGTPYWVTPIIKPTVGWFGGRDVKEIILCNALTGETVKYKIGEIPAWIDRVYPSDMILRQINYYGKYQDGFFNSLIGQKGVLRTTDLYNYIALNDDVLLFTGITSVSTEDNSNLGFVLVNMRTKETNFYPVASADESSAMHSAEGAVQEKGYIATVPILLNIGGRPSYCMALKDQASLVKMYALVDAQNYQTTGVGNSIKQAIENYEISQNSRLHNDPDPAETTTREQVSLEVTVADVQSIIIDGNTYYYFMIQKEAAANAEKTLSDQYFEQQVFSAPGTLSPHLAFLKPGDKISIDFYSPVNLSDITEETLSNQSNSTIEINSVDFN